MVVARARVVGFGGGGQIPMRGSGYPPVFFSHKSDQSLKVESASTLPQVLLTFLVKPFIKLCIVRFPCPQTLCSILMSIRSVGLTAKGEVEGTGATLSHLWPCKHFGRKEEKYILQPFDEQQGNKFINHHYMPHQTLCHPLHGSYTN